MFGLHYGGVRNTGKWLVVWTAGTALGGFVGVLAQVLQTTVTAAIAIALTWPLLLKEMAQKLQKAEPQQQDIGDYADEAEGGGTSDD